MAWQLAGRREIGEVLSFLKLREWSCVSFSSRLLANEGSGNHIFINRSDNHRNRISESVLVTDGGLIVPAIEPDQNPRESYRAELAPLIERSARRIHSIMGLDTQVGLVESLLRERASERLEYHLMTRERFNIDRPVPSFPDLVVRRASLADLAALFPLQRAYEKEEVLLNPDSFNAAASLLMLQKALRKELVYLAELEGKVVAKAGTNAQGLAYDQIGGVYTLPDCRNRGIARELMRFLMWEIAQRGKHLCLFVKKHNAAAVQLYRGLGFVVRDSFAISYYRS